jgi:hypothetical protein
MQVLTKGKTPTPKPGEMLRRLVQREWTADKGDAFCTSRKRGIIVVNGAAGATRRERSMEGSRGDPRLAAPREVHATKITHAPIRVDEVPAMRANATGRISGPIVGIGRGGSHDVCRVGGRVMHRLKKNTGL